MDKTLIDKKKLFSTISSTIKWTFHTEQWHANSFAPGARKHIINIYYYIIIFFISLLMFICFICIYRIPSYKTFYIYTSMSHKLWTKLLYSIVIEHKTIPCPYILKFLWQKFTPDSKTPIDFDGCGNISLAFVLQGYQICHAAVVYGAKNTASYCIHWGNYGWWKKWNGSICLCH